VDDGGGDGNGCFQVKVRADIAKFMNMKIAGFKSRHLLRKSKIIDNQ